MHCEGKLRAVAAIQDRDEITRYLKHQGIDHEAQARAPPRYRQQSLEFGQKEEDGLLRYERGHGAVTQEETLAAAEIAEEVVNWAKSLLV